MKKELFLIGIVVLLCSVGLSGCSSQKNNTLPPEKMMFVGTWKNTAVNSTMIMQFFSNGTFNSTMFTGLWDVKNGKFVLELPTYGYTFEYDYRFSDNNRTLTLVYTDGRIQVYAKQ